MYLVTTIRTTRAQDIVDAAGASATWKAYNGTRPAAGGALSGNTLLATLTGGASIGTVSNGVITLSAVTQNNALHVSGTPTFFRLVTSGGTLVADFVVGSDIIFTGTVTTGLDVDWSGTVTEGNAS